MTLRHIYIDESGTHAGSPIMSMAGYLFDSKQVSRFAREWERELRKFGLPFAHMTDSVTGNGHYKALSPHERIESEKALIRQIRLRTMVGCAVAVEPGYYNERLDPIPDSKSAYSFCLMGVVVNLLNWLKSTKKAGMVSFVLESGHSDQSEASSLLSELPRTEWGEMYHSHTFVGKDEAPQLQAADMLAWQFSHYIKRRENGHSVIRKDFAALIRSKDMFREVLRGGVDHWGYEEATMNEDLYRRIVERDLPKDDLAFFDSLTGAEKAYVKQKLTQ